MSGKIINQCMGSIAVVLKIGCRKGTYTTVMIKTSEANTAQFIIGLEKTPILNMGDVF